MRLIDADKLFDIFERELPNVPNQVYREMANAPTVKAIPIEWIKKYAKKGGRIANIMFPFEIEMMLDDWEKWEKENEANRR